MKIMEYPSVTGITSDNVLLIDGNTGTKKITAIDQVLSVLHLLGPQNHRRIFRGKNLGSALTTEQKTAIQNGTFEGLWIGDYWEIGGVKYRIADFDYWYKFGNTPFVNHHAVIMPDSGLGTAKMNDTSTTTNGYVGSKMYETTMAGIQSIVNSAFGSAVLTHRDFLINAVTSGYPSAGAYMDSSVELPNEIMIFGSHINAPSSEGTKDVKRYTINNRQLALFALAPELIISGAGYWLRDVASATHFCRVDTNGGATATGAANESGIRPVFPIG